MPLSVFGIVEDDPVLVGSRWVVARAQARLFDTSGRLLAVLSGRDAVDVREGEPECRVAALRFGGPEYSVTTFSLPSGEVVARFPWIPHVFDPDFDYRPSCDGQGLAVHSQPATARTRPAPSSASSGAADPPVVVLVLRSGSEKWSEMSLAAGERVVQLTPRLEAPGTLLVTEIGGKLRAVHLGRAGKRSPAGAPSSSGALGGDATSPFDDAAGNPTSRRPVKLERAEIWRDRLLLTTAAGSLELGRDGSSPASRRSVPRAGFVSVGVLDGPDGGQLLVNPWNGRQLRVHLAKVEDGSLQGVFVAPSGVFQRTDSSLAVFYPVGRELLEPGRAEPFRCQRLEVSSLLGEFLEVPAEPSSPRGTATSSSSSSSDPTSVPATFVQDPRCDSSNRARIGDMLGP